MKFKIPCWFLLFIVLCCLSATGCRREIEDDGFDPGEGGFTQDDDSDPYHPRDDEDGDNHLVPGIEPTGQCTSGERFTYIIREQGHAIPYPSDLYTRNDPSSPTGRRVFIDKDDAIDYLKDSLSLYRFALPAINRLDGFGVSTPVWFPATAPPNLSLIPTGEEPDADGALFCAVMEGDEHPYAGQLWPVEASWIEERGLLAVRPLLPFIEKTTYACVITDQMLTSQNDCYERADHFEYMLLTKPDSNHPQSELLEPTRQQLAPLFDELETRYGVKRDEILDATFFTTQWVSHDLLSVRDQLEGMANSEPPSPGDWTLASGSGNNLDSVWETRYPTINWRKKGVFTTDDHGDPVSQGEEMVTLRLSLPQKDIGGYSQPYPVILFGHGVNASRTMSTSFARQMAPYGVAVVGIDWVYHGDRSGWLSTINSDIASVIRSLLFFNVLDPLKMRDNMKQGIADLFWLKFLVRQLGELDLLPYETGGDGIPDLDVDTIYYAGMSLGSIHGGIAAAVEPEIPTWLLNVGGAEFRSIAFEGAAADLIFGVLDLLDSQFGLDLETDLLMMGDLVFSVSDAGDPYAYGPYLFQEPLVDRGADPFNVFLQMAAYDHTLGGVAGGQMAKAIGLTQVRPCVWPMDFVEQADAPFTGSGVYQFDTDNHNMLFSGDCSEQSRLQAGTWLRTALENGTATIIDPPAAP